MILRLGMRDYLRVSSLLFSYRSARFDSPTSQLIHGSTAARRSSLQASNRSSMSNPETNRRPIGSPSICLFHTSDVDFRILLPTDFIEHLRTVPNRGSSRGSSTLDSNG